MFEWTLDGMDGRARAGRFSTPHGVLETPLFAPVGTQATVKAMTPVQLRDAQASLILANTYHLYLRPGAELIAQLGGLHAFMGWEAPILTDSGGYQVFSLADRRVIDQDGVTFSSHLDGSEHRFTPQSAIATQELLGADIIMAFDECPEPYDHAYNQQALARTHAWAERCLDAKKRTDQALFGIVQGGIFPDLRRASAEFIGSLDFPGNAIGGLSVGESKDEMYAILEIVDAALPQHRPRYLMGVGAPEDLVQGVLRGVDIFDCVLPTRMARNHTALTMAGRMNMHKAAYREDSKPLDPGCSCYACRSFSRAYLRHLCLAKEMLAGTLLSIHNIHTLISLMRQLRSAILAGKIEVFSAEFLSTFQSHRPEGL